MAGVLKSLINSAKSLAIGDSGRKAGLRELFPVVDKSVDGEDCDRSCETCTVHYPKSFKINEDDELYGFVKGWSTHVLIATGKSDWVHDVANEKGSLMQAIANARQPTNGRLLLSASNMPTPHNPPSYSEPTTVLLLPAFILIENVTPATVQTMIDKIISIAPTTTTPLSHTLPPIPRSLEAPLPEAAPVTLKTLTTRACPHAAVILLCSQKTRDARCGQSAPLLRREFMRHLQPLGLARDLDDERPGGVGIYFVSHVGGHKYAANVLVYRKRNAAFAFAPGVKVDDVGHEGYEEKKEGAEEKGSEEEEKGEEAAQCIWLARVRPEDCEGIVKYTVLKGKVVKPEKQLRGGFNREKGLLSW